MDTRTRQRQIPRRTDRRTHRDPRVCREAPEQASVLSAGGALDSAHYACGCGHAFSAGVSTSVECPRCGADQAW
jgi:hypothetical protein